MRSVCISIRWRRRIGADALWNPFDLALFEFFLTASFRLSARIRRAGHFLLLVQEKVAKENTPRMPRRLRRCARSGRGSLIVRPCTNNELARIVRATFQAFPTCPRRGKRGPEDQELNQEHGVEGFLLLRAGARCSGFSGSPLHCGVSGRSGPAGVRAMDRAHSAIAHGRAISGTRPLTRTRSAGCASGAMLWGVSLCLLSLHEQRK